jgi:MYXO-CTERM domain-containing protein
MQHAAAAIEVAKMPAAAFVPNKLPAAGRGGVVSATFSSTAAGGSAEMQPLAAADNGCSVAGAPGSERSRPAFALFALGVGLALHVARRRRPHA